MTTWACDNSFPRRTHSSLNLHQLWTPRNRRCDLHRMQVHRNNWRGHKAHIISKCTWLLRSFEKRRASLCWHPGHNPQKPYLVGLALVSPCHGWVAKRTFYLFSLVSVAGEKKNQQSFPCQLIHATQAARTTPSTTAVGMGSEESVKAGSAPKQWISRVTPQPRNKTLNITSPSTFPGALKNGR